MADRSSRLFELLSKSQALRTIKVQDIANYFGDGHVLWIADLPAAAPAGLPTWQSPAIGAVRRHVLTIPVSLEVDTSYGALSARTDNSATGYAPELQEFVEATRMAAPTELLKAERSGREDNIEPFDRDEPTWVSETQGFQAFLDGRRSSLPRPRLKIIDRCLNEGTQPEAIMHYFGRMDHELDGLGLIIIRSIAHDRSRAATESGEKGNHRE
ncbi:hypothetical protein KO481_05650 [Nocardia sp. NEAU-G5]|uniref:Uncharacterized protein n=1 Tax=Nocardia albiluteola TaxID=2842303 RepID=A0ABS6ASK0_9NOCA|nr:hypothetical protein [Nocardia albiluteola]MBU3061008.1 hypothetical protein [Nocardia albiluteola]